MLEIQSTEEGIMTVDGTKRSMLLHRVDQQQHDAGIYAVHVYGIRPYTGELGASQAGGMRPMSRE